MIDNIFPNVVKKIEQKGSIWTFRNPPKKNEVWRKLETKSFNE